MTAPLNAGFIQACFALCQGAGRKAKTIPVVAAIFQANHPHLEHLLATPKVRRLPQPAQVITTTIPALAQEAVSVLGHVAEDTASHLEAKKDMASSKTIYLVTPKSFKKP